MRASQLRLDSYWVDELCFSLNEEYVYDSKNDPVLSPEDLDIEVEPFRNPDNPLQWYFKLAVRLDNKAEKFPYEFVIRLTGFFDVSQDCPPREIEQLALVNSPSILYASARELLAMVTGRSRYLSMILPSVRFFDPPKAKKLEDKETSASKEKKTTTAKKVATRSRKSLKK